MFTSRFLMCLLVLVSLSSCRSSSPASQSEAEGWVATWHSGVTDREGDTKNITYRLWIHNAVGGESVRLRFSNRYGKEALVLRNVSIARSLVGAELPPVDEASVVPVTFGGRNEVSIPVGKEMRSDAVTFALADDSDIAVTFYVPHAVTNVSGKGVSLTTSWSNGANGGDASGDYSGLSLVTPELGWPFLDGLEVVAPEATTVVALGDSITDGAFEAPNTDGRWSDVLADRIAASDLAGKRSVVNAGISGNMVTADRDGGATQGQAAITRMTWDAFDLPNVSHIILYEGVNDVCQDVPGSEIINGARKVIAEAHRRGIKVVVATIAPSFGALLDTGCTTHEAQRQPFNQWVLNSGEPDDIIDFNAAVSNGLSPEMWQPQLTVDFLHPNPLGLITLANAVPLDVLR